MTEAVGKAVAEKVKSFPIEDNKKALSYIMEELAKSNLDKAAQVLVLLYLARTHHELLETQGYVNWVMANRDWNAHCIL